VTDETLPEPYAPSAMRVQARARPAQELRTLPGRLEWNAALARESVRAARYGRPAAVLIVELIPERSGQDIDPWLRTLAGPISRTLRQDCRDTDLVARVAGARFQVLLPETDEHGAARLADRVAEQCRTFIQGAGARVAIRISVAGTSPDDTLHDALAHALRSIEAA
jgi:PleD family two-component response regulator